jgi:hypothetical protein
MFSQALAQRKASLILRCEADRIALAADAAVFRQRARWIELGWDLGRTVLPHMKLLAPVLGFLAARSLPQGIRLLGRLHSLWQVGQRALSFLSGFRTAWKR